MWLQIGIRWPGIFLILYASIVSKVHLSDRYLYASILLLNPKPAHLCFNCQQNTLR